jgi:hypothetical protein
MGTEKKINQNFLLQLVIENVPQRVGSAATAQNHVTCIT